MPLHHAGTQILKTKRLVLRPLSLDDAQAMYDNWASDPQVTRFMNWPTHENIEVTRAILAEWVPQYQDPSYYHWCITLEGEPVGAISILNIQERSMAGELGYNIGRKWWRQGITSGAAQAVLDFAFGVVGFHRIEAIHAVANPGSGGVMKKCGMRYEGSPRQKYLSNRGIFEDCDQYAILREDWEQPKPSASTGGTRELHTARLTLRRFTDQDIEPFYRDVLSDRQANQFASWQEECSYTEFAQLFSQYILDRYPEPDFYRWAVVLDGEQPRLIGNATLTVLDERSRVGEIGYTIGREWWGHGYATEAAQEVLRFAFEQAGLQRVEALHAVDNPASGAVLRKCGMVLEGHLKRKYLSQRGQLEDCDLYRALAPQN